MLTNYLYGRILGTRMGTTSTTADDKFRRMFRGSGPVWVICQNFSLQGNGICAPYPSRSSAVVCSSVEPVLLVNIITFKCYIGIGRFLEIYNQNKMASAKIEFFTHFPWFRLCIELIIRSLSCNRIQLQFLLRFLLNFVLRVLWESQVFEARFFALCSVGLEQCFQASNKHINYSRRLAHLLNINIVYYSSINFCTLAK